MNNDSITIKTFEELKKQKNENLHLIGKIFRREGESYDRRVFQLTICGANEKIYPYKEDHFNPDTENFLYVASPQSIYCGKIKIEDFYKTCTIIEQ